MRYRAILLLIVVVSAFGVWAVWIADDGRGLFARRTPRPDYTSLLAKLSEPTSLAAEAMPFRKAVADLAERHGVEIRIDTDALKKLGVTADQTVTVAVDDISLRSALRTMCRLVHSDLIVVVDGESFVVTDWGSANSDTKYFEGRVYPLSPLLLDSTTISAKDLAMAIRGTIAPASWIADGGPEIEVLPAGVAVAHRLDVHLQIETLLQKLQYVADHPDDLRPIDVTDRRLPEQVRAEAALDRPITICLADTPLPQAVAELSDRAGVPVLLDAAAIEANLKHEADIAADLKNSPQRKVSGNDARAEQARQAKVTQWKVTVTADRQPLRDVLEQMLDNRPTRLATSVDDGVIWVTTWFGSRNTLRLYPIADLLPHTTGVPGQRREDLIWLLDTVGPEIFFGDFIIVGSVLTVRAGWERHHQIEQLLGGLREILDPMTDRKMVVPAASRPAAALAKETSVDVTDTELADVLADLSKRHRMNIVSDENRYELSRQVTFRAENITLEQALHYLLKPFGLAIAVGDNQLQVVSESGLILREGGYFDGAGREEFPCEMWCYDVRHLVDPDMGIVDAGQLVSLVKHLVEPTLWEQRRLTGAGVLDGVLVVSHRRSIHREVSALLQALSDYQRSPGSSAPIQATTEHFAGRSRLVEALNQRASLDYTRITVDDLAVEMTERFGFPVDVRLGSSSFFRDPPDPQLSGKTRDVSLGAGLDLLLLKSNLTFNLRLGRLLITATGDLPRDQYCDQYCRVYPVRDLVLRPSARPAPPADANRGEGEFRDLHLRAADYASLIKVALRFVPYDRWQDRMYGGAIDACEGALVVDHTWRAHREMERLLGRLRGLLWPQSHSDRGLTPLQRSLVQKTTLIAERISLEDVLADLARRHGIVIDVDWPRPVPESVDCRFEDVPLGDALDELVRPFGLEVCVHGEVLGLWSRREDTDRVLTTWVYDVRHLAPPSPPRPVMRARQRLPFGTNRSSVAGPYYPPGTTAARYDLAPEFTSAAPDVPRDRDFAAFMTDHVCRRSWGDDSKWSSASMFPGAGEDNVEPAAMMYRGLLVVRHRWRVHREIRRLLRALEEAQTEMPPVARLANDATSADRTALLEAVAATQDDRLVAYLLTLVRYAPPPAEAAVPVLVHKLQATSPLEHGALHSELCRTLSTFGAEAAEAVPLLARHLVSFPDRNERLAILRAITEIGAAPAGPQLGKHLAKIVARGPIDDTEMELTMTALTVAGPAAADAAEPLLRLLVMPEQDASPRIQALCRIDPEGNLCRQIVDRWKKVEDEKTRQLVPRAEKKLREIYGDPE